ncbi:hypothetical protein A0H76_1907 [Hepatospora eriocheir]|uniref:Uncharacterized protein n=1 Tax=Hepatospora eriocheir TaxID=1081669 RepID=A0A1X0QGL1_9MICR|nr:hypothetical protein A0H76_1907 [Hepatospora eriocheir]
MNVSLTFLLLIILNMFVIYHIKCINLKIQQVQLSMDDEVLCFRNMYHLKLLIGLLGLNQRLQLELINKLLH